MNMNFESSEFDETDNSDLDDLDRLIATKDKERLDENSSRSSKLSRIAFKFKQLERDAQKEDIDNEALRISSSLQDIEEKFMDEEEEDSRELPVLEVEGYVCPRQFARILTPMEFEEVVSIFKLYDANGNMCIDKYEARKLLLTLGLDSANENAEKLLSIIDKDNTGEVEFSEFVTFVVLLKQGDDRLKKYQNLLAKLQDSPLGELERQVNHRNLKMKFLLISSNAIPSNQHGKNIIELQISGIWHDIVNGKVVGNFGIKRFQGIGKSTREAKYQACTEALLKLCTIMPGIRYNIGEFPEEWLDWVDNNLARGVAPATITSILGSKGFHPHRNLRLMQRIICWQAFDKFLIKYPDLDIAVESSIQPNFKDWIMQQIKKGIDGDVLLNVLKDRGFDLMIQFPYFAQKLISNELGKVSNAGGNEPELLDFYLCCEKGYVDEVNIYCSCMVPLNEEALVRNSSEALTPLSLAARAGQFEVVKILLSYHASVNYLDRRGRTALHIAALGGHSKICEILLENGAMIFQGDNQGNSPLHLAALSNHPTTIDLLAVKSKQLVYKVTSGRQAIHKSKTFDDLVDELFCIIPEEKLRKSDSQRFEKCWIKDAANKLISLLDMKYQFMLPKTSEHIMEDVLMRFDPRPETGIFISVSSSTKQEFIPTIPSSNELNKLLVCLYNASCLDMLNNFNRTPLHVACDANLIGSHEKIIGNLVNVYGCNLFLRDKQSRRPIDLLILDRNVLNAPSATKLKEEILIEKRDQKLKSFSLLLTEEEEKLTKARRKAIMDECIKRGLELSSNLWNIVRVGSRLKTKYGEHYEVYEDPDSENLYFCYYHPPRDRFQVAEYSEYCWEPSIEMRKIRDYLAGVNYMRFYRSHQIRKLGDWEHLNCKITNAEIYFESKLEKIRYTRPYVADWEFILRNAKVEEVLGYGNEWEAYLDTYGNRFYRHVIDNYCQIATPLDAIKVHPSEQFCSALVFKNKAISQNWYTCEECSHEWNKSNEGSKSLLKLCEPCYLRCHQGHSGARYIRTAMSICNCSVVCKLNSCKCVARIHSPQQNVIKRKSLIQRNEIERQNLHNLLIPPVLAMVPPTHANGKLKSNGGWILCRRVPSISLLDLEKRLYRFPVLPTDDVVEIDTAEDLVFNETKTSSAISINEVSGYTPTTPNDTNTEAISMSSFAMTGSSRYSAITGDNSSDNSESDSSDDLSNNSLVIKTTTNIANDILNSETSPSRFHQDNIWDYPYKKAEDLPEGWVELYDVEEPNELPVGGVVLVKLIEENCHVYGFVLSAGKKKDTYLVKRYDNSLNELFHRYHLELVTKRIFYFNQTNGISAWNLKDAIMEGFETQPLTLPIQEFEYIFSQSMTRRNFENWEEVFNPMINMIFYKSDVNEVKENAAIKIQKLVRHHFRWSYPITPRLSTTYTMIKPIDVISECQIQAGWAYLRRRSVNLGEFKDIDGVEWEEYSDKVTSEYFYWTEEENRYQWEKPEVPNRYNTVRDLLSIGAEVLYRLAGKYKAEPVIITKIRFDDTTGEDMYDIVLKYNQNLKFKWIPRVELQRPALEDDELMLRRLEERWTKQIRAYHEASRRRKRRDREIQMKAEMDRLQKLQQMSGAISNNAINGDVANIMRGRVLRINAEATEVLEEQEATEGLIRKKKVQETFKKIAVESNISMTRAEVLSITRSIDMQIRMQERIEKQKSRQALSNSRKIEVQNISNELMDSLLETESKMTTPKSLTRRKIIREVHVAMQKQYDKLIICELGCGEWIRIGFDRNNHLQNRCPNRILPCALGCTLRLTEKEWFNTVSTSTIEKTTHLKKEELGSQTLHSDIEQKLSLLGTNYSITYQQHHELQDCPKRLVYCPNQCLEWVVFEDLEKHFNEQCSKRPAKHIFCRLGCDKEFGGNVELMLLAEEERLNHEREECQYRNVRCNWKFEDGRICAAEMLAKDRLAHRELHVVDLGVATYLVSGTYLYKVPSKVDKLKIKIWGAGGGSGYFKHRKGGGGGGGAFLEVILNVEPYEVLEIVVGSGGSGGTTGNEIDLTDPNTKRYTDLSNTDGSTNHYLIDESLTTGIGLGGEPGGGKGFGGSVVWAAGGGGGYSMISKRRADGNEPLIVASGGGGGSSLDGIGGCGFNGVLVGAKVNPLNGQCASIEGPGLGGFSGSILNSKWSASDGMQWQGGDGSQFGGGGGGGYFGGGGGGTSPGIGGGGGSGSSFLNLDRVSDYVVIHGDGCKPGGLSHNPPDACGIGEWDKSGGVVGLGGMGDVNETHRGNSGCVIIYKPGNF